VKGPWTAEEDTLLKDLIRDIGARAWNEIARHLPGRIGKQCRERWLNHLDPSLLKVPWTEVEDNLLKKLHHVLGNKWAEIAKLISGRSENSIKNRWNSACHKRKQMEGELQILLDSQSSAPTLETDSGESHDEDGSNAKDDHQIPRPVKKARMMVVSTIPLPSPTSSRPTEPCQSPLDLLAAATLQRPITSVPSKILQEQEKPPMLAYAAMPQALATVASW
jgi:hypothetical protein